MVCFVTHTLWNSRAGEFRLLIQWGLSGGFWGSLLKHPDWGCLVRIDVLPKLEDALVRIIQDSVHLVDLKLES
jgi:hypothetical protein